MDFGHFLNEGIKAERGYLTFKVPWVAGGRARPQHGLLVMLPFYRIIHLAHQRGHPDLVSSPAPRLKFIDHTLVRGASPVAQR